MLTFTCNQLTSLQPKSILSISFQDNTAALGEYEPRDLDPWAAVSLSSGCRLCLLLCYLSEHRKRMKWEHCDRPRSHHSLTSSYHSVGTYSQLQGIMEKLGHFIVSAPIISWSASLSHPPSLLSLSLSLSIFHVLLLPSFSHPFFTPYLNYFPFPFLSISLSSLHLSASPPHPHRHPSLPILIALHTGGNRQAGCLVSTSVIGRNEYKTGEKSGSFCFFVSSQWGSVVPTTAENKPNKLQTFLFKRINSWTQPVLRTLIYEEGSLKIPVLLRSLYLSVRFWCRPHRFAEEDECIDTQFSDKI